MGRLHMVLSLFSLGYLCGYVTVFWTSPYFASRDQQEVEDYNVADSSSSTLLRRIKQKRSIPLHSEDKDSYLLTLCYHEQMSNAIMKLLGLGPVAMNLNLKIVQPFVVHSRLYGLPGFLPKGDVAGPFYPLGTLFNTTSINESLYRYAKVSMVSFQDFVLHAPRDVTVVYFVHKEFLRMRTFCLTRRRSQLLQLVQNSSIVDCTKEVLVSEQLYSGLQNALLNITLKFGVPSFSIARFLCVSGERDVTTSELNVALGHGRKTVVFPTWRGCAYKNCNIDMRHVYTQKNRPRLLYTLEGEKQNLRNGNFVPSELVFESLEYYLNYLQYGNGYLSVHVRVEKLLKRNGVFHVDSKYLDCCLSVLRKTVSNVKKKYKLSTVLLVTDVGKYGTDSCQFEECRNASENFVSHLETAINAKVFTYDPNITPMKINNRGFVSLVEMNMLLGARRLVTVGSGLFSQKLTSLFESKLRSPKVYAICKEKGVHMLNEYKFAQC